MLAAAVGGAVAACAPPLPLVVLPPDGVSTLSVCARPRPAETAGRGPHRLCPLTAPAAPASQMAASAGGKSLRARCGVPLRPPVPLLRRLARQRRRAAPPAGSRHPIFLEWWRLAPPGPLRRRRPDRRYCSGHPRSGGETPRHLPPAPLRRRAPPLQPRPPVLAPGRGYFVFAAAGLGIAPPAGGAKGLPGCTRCAVWVRCTWLRHESSASRYRYQPRLTIVRRE